MGSKLEQASDRTASEKGKMVPWYLASGHGDVLPPVGGCVGETSIAKRKNGVESSSEYPAV